MGSTWWPATRANPRPWPKGAVRAPSQAGRRAGPGHAGEGQATHSRPDPARRAGSLAHAGQRAADDDPADHRGHGCPRRAHPYRRVWHLRPPACLGVSAQNGLPRARRIRPRRGWRRVLRGARQHDRGVLVPAALLARPHRGISQEKLPLYLGFFQFVHNARRRGKALLGALVAVLAIGWAPLTPKPIKTNPKNKNPPGKSGASYSAKGRKPFSLRPISFFH